MQHKTMHFLFLILATVILSSTVFSQVLSIKSVTESTISLKVDNPKSVLSLIVVREISAKQVMPDAKVKYKPNPAIGTNDKPALTGEGNYVVYSGAVSQDVVIKGLKSGTAYKADFYKFNKKDKSTTLVTSIDIGLLASEPKTQAKVTAFSGIKSDEFTIHFKWGDGKSRVILISEARDCDPPKDGTIYAASNMFGKSSLTSKSTYVVLNDSAVAKTVTVKGLKPATKYYVVICEANGSGLFVNYNTALPKPQGGTTTLAEPPVALEAADITETSFLAKWKGSDGATRYNIEVALDEKFTKYVEEYKSVDVGKIESILIEDLPKSDNFFYRLQAIGPNGKESQYSNIIKVSVKNK